MSPPTHWHGFTPQQDGVPSISGPPIRSGGSADYDFLLRFGGTFWMDSHEGLRKQALLAARLIIHDARDRRAQQEIVVMLADFSFTPAEEIFADLRNGGAMAGTAMATTKPVAAKMTSIGSRPGAATGPDLNDVKYDAFLANERTDVISVEPGGIILLRVINSSSVSAHHLDSAH